MDSNSLSCPPGFPSKFYHGRPPFIPYDNKDHSSMLDLGQIMADSTSQSPYSNPGTVHAHDVIDYNPMLNLVEANKVTITEVKEIHFFSPTSTRDRIFTSMEGQDLSFPFVNQLFINHSFNQNEQPVHNFYLPVFSPCHSNAIPNKISMQNLEPFYNVNYLQNPTHSNPDNFLHLNADLYSDPMVKTEAIHDPSLLNFAFVGENKNNQNINRSPEQVNEFVSTTPTGVHQNDCILISNDEEYGDLENDGKTHSLHHRKFGPYICPKCRKVFQTSQFFASHVHTAHYRFETEAQRKMRLAAKSKNKKDFEVIHSSDGITAVPATSGGGGKFVKTKPRTPRITG